MLPKSNEQELDNVAQRLACCLKSGAHLSLWLHAQTGGGGQTTEKLQLVAQMEW